MNRQMNQVDRGDRERSRLVYPTLNVFFSPRVFQQKIDHKSIPMCLYTRPIQASNIAKIFDQQVPDSSDLRQLQEKDGLIFGLKQMNRRPQKVDPNLNIGTAPLGIKMLVCVCMYNQSKNAINLTLNGIYDNLVHLQKEGISPQQVAVVLMQDGILKLVADRSKRTYAKGDKSMVEFYRRLDQLDGKPRCDLQQRINVILDEIDNYNRKGMSSYVGNNRDFPPSIQKNISLLYQNLWHPGMTDFNNQRQGQTFNHYLKIFTCFKHLNGTKLSSHLWFFQGFCRYLNPEFIVLLDVGTKPQDTGVVNLIRGFNDANDKNVGGVTGLMSVDSQFPSEEGGGQQEQGSNCFTQCLKDAFCSIQKAQEYEYIIAHFLDKNAQGALGFLHVLPGAWSAYRYRALIKSQEYQPNLLEHSYFKMILNPEMEEKDYKEANMYLAQDRILSLGIYCQVKQEYYLKYIPDAIAYTDPMKTHQDLMKQRRRWINSSLFAFLYVFKNYYFNAMESKHGFFDKYVKLNLSMILALLSFCTSYLTPSIYFYVLFSTIYQIDPSQLYITIASKVVSILYIMVYLIAVAGGLTGSVWTKHAHVVSGILSFFTFAMWALVTYNIVVVYLGFTTTGIDFGNFNQVSVLVMTIINLLVYYIIIFMHVFTHPRFVFRIFKDQISYMTFQGAYAQTMVAHAFTNVDDVSWGTKGSTGGHGGGKKYETQKVFFVSSWLFYNCLLAYIMVYIDVVVPESGTGPQNNRKVILIVIAFYGTIQMFLKAALAIYYHIKWCVTDCTCLRKQLYPDRLERVETLWRHLNNKYRPYMTQMLEG